MNDFVKVKAGDLNELFLKISQRDKEIVELKSSESLLLDVAESKGGIINMLAENLFCAGEVIKRSNNELGGSYVKLANEHKA